MAVRAAAGEAVHQVTNNGTMTVANLKTAQPYNGNFLELTVVDVTRAN